MRGVREREEVRVVESLQKYNTKRAIVGQSTRGRKGKRAGAEKRGG